MITFENFSFKYDAQSDPTLKNITMTIEQGQKVLIIGPSGSGKSTLGHLLNGIVPNSFVGEKSGVFTINGKDAFDMSIYEKSQLVSTVLQDTDGQFVGLSVEEDLAFALENDCMDQQDMKQHVSEWSNRLSLTQLLKHRPQDLSGGQKQRVSLGGVLIDDSPILLFDEPLANLDPHTGQETIALIDTLHKQENMTTIIIEHRLEDVLHRPIDKVIYMYDGTIIFDGTVEELLKTTLLSDYGIREPLYITSLRQHGFPIDKIDNIASVDAVSLPFSNINLQTGFFNKHNGEPVLALKDVSFSYEKNRKILNNVSLTIHQGERIAIVGRNGAGKSTLAKALCKYIDVTGSIFYRGADVSNDSIAQRASRIGYVLQNPNQMISQAMIFDEVALGLRLKQLSEQEIEEKVHQVLKICGLYAYRRWPISALSYGQKKRVTIASILVLDPDVILLDEPTAGQDMKHYEDMMQFLNTLNEAGHTILMITHDMQLMMEYSDRTIVLDNGTIIADATPSEILTRPDIIERAHLKTTSLFTLANRLSVDPLALTQDYILKRG